MLRKSTYNKIKNTLSAPPFIYAEDFDISTSKSNNSVQLLIKYACGDGEYFLAIIPPSKSGSEFDDNDFKIVISYSPGELIQKENTKAFGASEMLSNLNDWVNRLSEEIKNEPIYRTINLHQTQMQQLEKELENIPDDYASVEQVDRIKQWMEEVEEKLKKDIESLAINAQEKDKKFTDLEEQFEILRNRAETTKIKKIFRTTFGRIISFASNPNLPQLVKNGKQIAGILTGDGNITNEK